MSRKTPKKLYSIAQVAEIMDKKPPQILQQIRKGNIKARKIGWVWVISEDEVEKLKQK